jgi:hypothetical protein
LKESIVRFFFKQGKRDLRRSSVFSARPIDDGQMPVYIPVKFSFSFFVDARSRAREIIASFSHMPFL